MALRFIDGCGEVYVTADLDRFWDSKDAGVNVDATGGRRGGAAIRLNGINDDVRKGIIGAATVVTGFAAFRVAYGSGNTTICNFLGPSSTHVVIQITASGAIRVTSSSLERAVSAGGVFFIGTWHYLEIKCFINNTTGTIEVKVDGNTVINFVGDTLNSGLAQVNAIAFFGNGTSNQTFIDDVYILDDSGAAPYNDFLGDSRVDAVLADGDGFVSQFDTTFPASPTTHYTKIDEAAPNDDTDYNETNTPNDQDLFDFAAMATIVGGATVWAVQMSAYLKKMDAGPATFELISRPLSTTRTASLVQYPSIDYRYFHEVLQLNPETSAEWTESEVDASEFGIEAL